MFFKYIVTDKLYTFIVTPLFPNKQKYLYIFFRVRT